MRSIFLPRLADADAADGEAVEGKGRGEPRGLGLADPRGSPPWTIPKRAWPRPVIRDIVAPNAPSARRRRRISSFEGRQRGADVERQSSRPSREPPGFRCSARGSAVRRFRRGASGMICTPSSPTSRNEARLKIWNPPLSVRIAPSHEAIPVEAAERADRLVPRAQVEMVRVAQDSSRAARDEALPGSAPSRRR